MNTLFGKKVQQTQGFLENGSRIPVTVIAASGNVVMGSKTEEKDTYSAIKVGFGKTKKTTKALIGEMRKAHLDYIPEAIYEVKLGDSSPVEIGTMLKVEEIFKPGDIVDVTGMSKGKGFAGGVKRYNFRGGPKTHGQSDRHRAPGSIGSGTTPGRVYKGKRMAGNMGNDTVTIKNLIVIDLDAVSGKLFVKGLVPGILNGIVSVTKVGEVKSKNFVPFFKVAEPEAPQETTVEEKPTETVKPAQESISEAKEEKTEQAVVEASDGQKDLEEVTNGN